MRLCACTGVGLDIIEPCSFPWDERKIKQSAMDYAAHVKPQRHQDWQHFLNFHQGHRIVLLTTKTDLTYVNFKFEAGDILLAGSESAGVPAYVHDDVDSCITIPMQAGMRSLNVGMACSMVLGEAMRQRNGL